MAQNVALITGITGQDGALLAEFLLAKGYVVHGLWRRASTANTDRIAHLLDKSHPLSKGLHLHVGDLTDSMNLVRVVQETSPTEIYNLAAQSDVKVSFDSPEYTANTDALGTLRLLEAVRVLGREKQVRFYQASTSELFGGRPSELPQDEKTPFYPRSPYGAAKLYAYWITINYREAYGIFASNGILFNHEGPTRGEGFVTRKISRAVAAIHFGLQDSLSLGNLDAARDWGHAQDYIEGMWMILQHNKPDDFVLATGEARTVREFVELAFDYIDRPIEWRGKGVEEVGVDRRSGQILVKVDPRYYRPTEVDKLLGNPDKARRELGWMHKIGFNELVTQMVASDMKLVMAEAVQNGRVLPANDAMATRPAALSGVPVGYTPPANDFMPVYGDC